tara:strand:+ start:277 stop:723 length:447 start_codon:yes stop_codon:yes gene_type:complete
MNKILIGIAIAIAFVVVFYTQARADSVNAHIQDHYKSVVQQTPQNQQVCSEVYVPNRNTAGPDSMLSGAIIGGIIGNNVTKNLPDGGTAGAIIGGLLGLQNEQNAGGSYQTRCSTRTTYTESQKTVYSHSTITFTDSNGTRRTLKFYK